MPAEVEAKFRADGPGALDALAKRPGLADASLGPARTVVEQDRYVDTADRRLAAEGWACRLRTRDGSVRVSLKGPHTTGGAGWLHSRSEVEAPATASLDPADWPPSEARDLAAGLSGGASLAEVFRLDQRRTERPVSIDGRSLGVLSLDVAAISTADRAFGELHAVELELDAGADPESGAALARIAGELAAIPGLTADPLTKLEHALERIRRG